MIHSLPFFSRCENGLDSFNCDTGGGVDNFHSVKYYLLALFFLAVTSFDVRADYSVLVSYSRVSGCPVIEYVGVTPEAACSQAVGLPACQGWTIISSSLVSPIYCTATSSTSVLNANGNPVVTTYLEEYTVSFFEPPPPPPPSPCPAAGVSTPGITGLNWFGIGFPLPSFLCINSCQYSITSGSAAKSTLGVSFSKWYAIAGNSLGTSCTTTSAVSNADLEQGCLKNGESFITFNGVTTCVAPASPGAEPVTKTSSGSTSSISTTASGVSSTTTLNQDNSVSYGDNNVTTTTTVINPDGSKQTETKTETIDDYCQKNPTDKVCKRSDSSFGGSCSAFTCDGDAIQCAIAREQHQRNCTLYDTSTSLSDLGNQVATDSDPLKLSHPALPANRLTVNLSSSLDTSKNFTASCPADKIVMVQGQEITIPFSKLCPYLQFMGAVVVAFSLLGAMRIVGVT